MNLIETPRLSLRRLDLQDAGFILDLLNQETFIRHIGDKGVRDLADACEYLMQGPLESYRKFGFGLYLTVLREEQAPIGICGLVKRSSLADVDIGFAFLPRYGSKGYGFEAAAAVLEYGRRVLQLRRIVAIVAPDNHASIAVIGKIGLRYERALTLDGDPKELSLYGPPDAPALI